jgi:hypothetical protein
MPVAISNPVYLSSGCNEFETTKLFYQFKTTILKKNDHRTGQTPVNFSKCIRPQQGDMSAFKSSQK